MPEEKPVTPPEAVTQPSEPEATSKPSTPPTIRPKWLLPGVIAGAVVLVAVVGWFVVRSNSAPDGESQQQTSDPLDTSGYTFINLSDCTDYFIARGAIPGDAEATCQRLEREGASQQAAGSSDFEPMPIACTPPNNDQWYRTDNTLVLDPTDPNTLYVNIEWKGFYKSTDGGKTWTRKTNGIVVDHKDQETGNPCYGEYPVAVIDPSNPKRILLATSGGGGGTIKDQNMRGGGVYETTDGGETWKQTITDSMNGYVTHALVLDPKDSSTFYYGTAASPASYTEADPNKIWVSKGIIYKATKGGATWEELSTGFIKNARLTSIVIDPANSQRITAAAVVMIHNPSGPNTVSEEQMGIIQSVDGGQSWTRIDNLPAGYQAALQMAGSPTNGNNLFFIAATAGGTKSKSFFSGDTGKTWTESTESMDLVAFDPHDSSGKRILGYLWQCTGPCSRTLHESTDGGKTWKEFGTLPTEISNVTAKETRLQNIVWSPADSNTIYLSGAGGLVWKSINNGQSWTKLLSYDQLTD